MSLGEFRRVEINGTVGATDGLEKRDEKSTYYYSDSDENTARGLRIAVRNVRGIPRILTQVHGLFFSQLWMPTRTRNESAAIRSRCYFRYVSQMTSRMCFSSDGCAISVFSTYPLELLRA